MNNMKAVCSSWKYFVKRKISLCGKAFHCTFRTIGHRGHFTRAVRPSPPRGCIKPGQGCRRRSRRISSASVGRAQPSKCFVGAARHSFSSRTFFWPVSTTCLLRCIYSVFDPAQVHPNVSVRVSSEQCARTFFRTAAIFFFFFFQDISAQ